MHNKPHPLRYFPYLDSIKGFGILLVVMGHTCTYLPVFRWIYSFHMALFFIIAGLLFHPRPFRQTLVKKARRLLLPYAFFAVITFAYWAVIEQRLRPGDFSVPNAFANLFLARAGADNYPQNAVLWFLPCLFVTEMIFLLVYRCVTKISSEPLQRLAFLAVIVLCLLMAYFSGRWLVGELGIRLPWALDIVPFSLALVMMGQMMQPLLPSSNKVVHAMTPLKRTWLILLGIVGMIVLWVFDQFTSLSVNLNGAFASNVLWMVIASLLGFAASTLFCMGSDNRVLRYLGTASLTIMCVHEPIKRVVIQLCSIATGVDGSILRENPFICLAFVAITVAICIIGHAILNRFCPILIGNSRQASQAKCRLS